MNQILKYQVPESWDEITLAQQLQVERLTKENPDYSSLAILSAYCAIPMEMVKRMPMPEVKKLLTALTFISSPLPNDPVGEFEFKGENYSILPSLLKGEFQDFISIDTALNINKGREYNALPMIVAVLAKKQIGKGYKYESLDQYNPEERAKIFLDLPITIAHRVHLFFCLSKTLLEQDSKAVLSQFDQSINEQISSMLNTPKQPAGGVLSFLLHKALRIYLRFLKSSWKQSYSGYNSDQLKLNWTQTFKELFRKKRRRN